MNASALISIVVPTRNRAGLLRGCIESLLAQDFPANRYEVIIVNDGSTDDTADVLRVLSTERGSPKVRGISIPGLGVNAARNAGIRNALGDIICVVDDDELVERTYLRLVSDVLEQAPELDGAGGPYRPFGRSRVPTCSRCVLGAADFPGTGRRRVRRLFGGNMALRRKLFDSRGLFDEELSGFGDEVEWFLRAPGLELLYDPDLWVWHRRDQQSFFQLCRSAWTQGTAIPLANAKVGRTETPSISRLLRYLGHGVIHFCAAGVILACREYGAIHAASGLKRGKQRARPGRPA